MQSGLGSLQYPAPLAVSFHRWEDQSSPMLRYSCFVSVQWDGHTIPNSQAWSDPDISSVLFCGTECGVVVAYKIVSKSGHLIDVCPLSLIFGHQCKISSIVECDSLIYRACVASLSTDGTLSLISVEDLTIVINQKALFSENSTDLAAHSSNTNIMLALQSFGTIEVANIYDGTLIYKISGFPSIITRLVSMQNLHAVSCVDGSVAVFSVSESGAACICSVKNECREDFSVSLVSPDMTYILFMTSTKWALYDSSEPLFEKCIEKESDYYIKGNWISNSRFYVCTLGGRIEVWEADVNTDIQIIDRAECVKARFTMSSLYATTTLETTYSGKPDGEIRQIRKPPTLVYAVERKSNGFAAPVGVTTEGFVVISHARSAITVYGEENHIDSYLQACFKYTYKARCPIGDPIAHEAKIGSKGDQDGLIFLDGAKEPVGVHHGAFRLYSPPVGESFFSFSDDGSVFQWDARDNVKDRKLGEYYDLGEAVSQVVWIEEKQWMVVVGNEGSFSVIEPLKRQSVLLCSGHNSPIVEIMYSGGLIHARCESSSIYAWNIDGQLVSKRKAKVLRKIGHSGSQFAASQSEPSLHKLADKTFTHVVPLIMPNCQTFAVVLDINEFLEAHPNCDDLNIRDDPAFLLLKLLWKCHAGEGKIGTDVVSLLSSFHYAIAGDNHTVSLPISRRSQEFGKLAMNNAKTRTMIESPPHSNTAFMKEVMGLRRMSRDKMTVPKSVAFDYSPLLSAVHAVAASTLAQCFVNSQCDEHLPIMYAYTQAATSMKLPMAVTPSVLVLADWLGNSNYNLRVVIVSVLGELIKAMSEEEAKETLEAVQRLYNDWCVLLVFMLIIASLYDLPVNLIHEIEKHAFPLICEHREMMELMISAFPRIAKQFIDIGSFYEALLGSADHYHIKEMEIIAFAMESPLDFLSTASLNKHCSEFIVLMFQRWKDPDRSTVMQFIMNMLKNKQLDFGKLFTAISQRIPYVGNCKQYVAVGTEDGHIMIISKDTLSIIWKQQFSSNPVTFVSCAPNGSKFALIVEKDNILTWVFSSKSKEPFEVAGTATLDIDTSPTIGHWKSDTKITLATHTEAIKEIPAPKTSFFARLMR